MNATLPSRTTDAGRAVRSHLALALQDCRRARSGADSVRSAYAYCAGGLGHVLSSIDAGYRRPLTHYISGSVRNTREGMERTVRRAR